MIGDREIRMKAMGGSKGEVAGRPSGGKGWSRLDKVKKFFSSFEKVPVSRKIFMNLRPRTLTGDVKILDLYAPKNNEPPHVGCYVVGRAVRQLAEKEWANDVCFYQTNPIFTISFQVVNS